MYTSYLNKHFKIIRVLFNWCMLYLYSLFYYNIICSIFSCIVLIVSCSNTEKILLEKKTEKTKKNLQIIT